MDREERLRVAVQKSGRLTDHSLDLMSRCGLKYSRGKDQLLCYGENMPLDVLLVRDDDIPDLVREDVCDLGIVGGNVVHEKRLGFIARGVEPLFEVLQPLAFLAGVDAGAPQWEYRFPTVVGVRYEGVAGRVPDAGRLDVDRAARIARQAVEDDSVSRGLGDGRQQRRPTFLLPAYLVWPFGRDGWNRFHLSELFFESPNLRRQLSALLLRAAQARQPAFSFIQVPAR